MNCISFWQKRYTSFEMWVDNFYLMDVTLQSNSVKSRLNTHIHTLIAGGFFFYKTLTCSSGKHLHTHLHTDGTAIGSNHGSVSCPRTLWLADRRSEWVCDWTTSILICGRAALLSELPFPLLVISVSVDALFDLLSPRTVRNEEDVTTNENSASCWSALVVNQQELFVTCNIVCV